MATQARPAEHAREQLAWWIRAIYFVLVGWWLTAVTLCFAYICLLTIVGIPIGFWLFDRVPLVLTLKLRDLHFHMDGSVSSDTPQRPLIWRSVYFVLAGWWVGALWIAAAYALLLSIWGIPVAVVMLNRVPAVMTLQRG